MLRTRCCPGGVSTEPPTRCNGTTTIPPHPSTPSRRELTTGESFSTDVIAVGANATMTVEPATNGRHPFALRVTAGGALWHALHICWLHTPSIDPRIVGSLFSVQAGASVKIGKTTGWTAEQAKPWLVAGCVVEQDGTLYYALRTVQLTLSAPNPCCWIGAGGGGSDSLNEPCRATRKRLRSEQTTSSEVVVGGSGILSADSFGELLDDGTIDLDRRPNFNLHGSLPITRIGYVVGLSSCPGDVAVDLHGTTGEWSCVGVLGPICGTVLAHGSPHVAGSPTAPMPPGNLLINESLSSLPVGWASGTLGLDDEGLRPEGGGNSAQFTTRDEATFVENVNAGEYRAGTLYTEFPSFLRPDWKNGTRLTIEWTHRRVRDADRRYTPPTPDPIQYRNQTCGVFVGGLFRFFLRHENAARFDDKTPQPRYGWTALAPVHPFGGQIVDYPYADFPPEWPFDSLEPPALPVPVRWQLAGEDAFDGRQPLCNLAAPNDGDRVTLVLKLSIESRLNQYTTETANDRIDVWVWELETWINGRTITPSTPVSQSGGKWVGVPPETLRIGLCAFYGGGWQDLKTWLHIP